MLNKWKMAFFVSVGFTVIILIGAVYLLVGNTITSGINYDNNLTISEDIDNISKAIRKKAYTIKEFDKELLKSMQCITSTQCTIPYTCKSL
jgi:hypothetical protein